MSAEARSDLDFDRRAPSAGAPGRWLTRKLVKSLFARVATGRATIVLPNGRSLSSTMLHAGPEAVLVLHRWRALRRLVVGGDVAFAEAYIEGDWSTPDLVALVELAARNYDAIRQTISGFVPARLFNRLRHALRPNSPRGSRRNIMAHYDLGNAFYAAWLDEGMSYSSGLYRSPADTLDDAQRAKQDRIIDALDLSGGESVLEIGCGWGGLAERLAERGCRVVGLTLSPAQLAHAQERVQRAGLGDRVELRLQDYRDVRGSFDRIVSVEMIEAVGQSYWPSYFGVLRERLAPGGHAVIQAITIADQRFPSYAETPDFIQRHVFPGGMLPSPSILGQQAEAAGMGLRTDELFGLSYAETLRVWRERFLDAWPEIARQGFDERFRRLWDYYLAYCEAGFRSGTTDVGIYSLLPKGR